ncbi:MAG: BlaI/MecI/CopY family transcriptional regulator [Verrucomicrobiaceae bacterium]|nr:BlaI/MecI/CopY family transcriptional regulator [Verrucomicrobiaceae bacterium]
MSAPAPKITEAEWTVMRVFWQLGEASLGDVVRALEDQLEWKPRTVQSLMRRLVEKGALVSESQGRDFRYRPAFSQDECQLDEGKTFLQRVFDGRLTPFVAAMVEKEEISRDEIRELRALLDEAEKKTSTRKRS